MPLFSSDASWCQIFFTALWSESHGFFGVKDCHMCMFARYMAGERGSWFLYLGCHHCWLLRRSETQDVSRWILDGLPEEASG
jgi:hypothetical protein